MTQNRSSTIWHRSDLLQHTDSMYHWRKPCDGNSRYSWNWQKAKWDMEVARKQGPVPSLSYRRLKEPSCPNSISLTVQSLSQWLCSLWEGHAATSDSALACCWHSIRCPRWNDMWRRHQDFEGLLWRLPTGVNVAIAAQSSSAESHYRICSNHTIVDPLGNCLVTGGYHVEGSRLCNCRLSKGPRGEATHSHEL
jgi:hypothetical protein